MPKLSTPVLLFILIALCGAVAAMAMQAEMQNATMQSLSDSTLRFVHHSSTSPVAGVIDTSGWKTYSSPDVGTFKYPPDWEVSRDTENGSALVIGVYPQNNKNLNPQNYEKAPGLDIWISGELNGKDETQSTVDFFKNSTSNFTEASATIGGTSAVRVNGFQNVSAPGSQPFNGERMTWVLVSLNKATTVFYQFRGDDNEKEFNQILSTFKFTN